jgi:large subunit ribosomal protein L21
MYAIVEIAGQQTKVEAGKYVYANRLAGNVGDVIEFGNVLLTEANGTVRVGTILEHLRGDKIRVFKKKRRKGYRKTIGHRSSYTKVLIDKIG